MRCDATQSTFNANSTRLPTFSLSELWLYTFGAERLLLGIASSVCRLAIFCVIRPHWMQIHILTEAQTDDPFLACSVAVAVAVA